MLAVRPRPIPCHLHATPAGRAVAPPRVPAVWHAVHDARTPTRRLRKAFGRSKTCQNSRRRTPRGVSVLRVLGTSACALRSKGPSRKSIEANLLRCVGTRRVAWLLILATPSAFRYWPRDDSRFGPDTLRSLRRNKRMLPPVGGGYHQELQEY
jgi:hypothetical protein